RSAKIIHRLEAMEAVRSATTIALFWPIESRHEIDLRAFDATVRRRSKVAYPAIDENRSMTFRFVDDPGAMKEEGLGFRQPDAAAPVAEALDVIVVPALAVDPRGHRLGYGAGYYDRALAAMPSAIPIAVAFDFQLLAEIPVSPADVPVKWIVTDTRVLCSQPPPASSRPPSGPPSGSQPPAAPPPQRP